jgi:predicted amidophosphoribosyltransferase
MLSHSLLRFKSGEQPDLDGWTDCSLEMLQSSHLPPGTILIRALRHEETRVQESTHPGSLDLLGQSLAAAFNCQYRPQLIRKSRSVRPAKSLSRQEREKELLDVYQLNPTLFRSMRLSETAPPSFFVLDDILTTGTTVRMILKTLTNFFPDSRIGIFTLARADHDHSLNKSAPPRGQNYQIDPQEGWKVAEEDFFYYALNQLKNHIRANSFPP